ncbi:uncharacterized protein LOC114542274 [Dendronephthya gigantea]|uniref:uncharacterized protein LOC114542274 n=1 Tax=Dendronephthya gigantea TaxID=151771 RepID=UPI001069BF99|nr:uncharacterized protein LOC114542274 [Dendronephthya gigantea]
MATAKWGGKRRKNKQSLEASLEELHRVGKNLKTSSSKKLSTFLNTYDGSGKRVPSNKYKYRSPAERHSKQGAASSQIEGDLMTESEYGMLDSDDELYMAEMSGSRSTTTESLSNCIETCSQISEEIKSSSQSEWTKRMLSVEENWESSRSAIFDALLKSHAVPSPDNICFLCNEGCAVVRCHECGPRVLLCSACDEKVHETNPLHDRDVWVNGFFQEIPPTTIVSEDGSLGFVKRCAPFALCKACLLCKEQGSLILVPLDEPCIVVTSRGRYDLSLCMYRCGNCDKAYSPLSLEKIISEGYWPGNPKHFNHVFSQDLFRLWDSVRKHMPGTSESAFIRSLGNLSSNNGRSSTINVTVFHRAFKEWCFAMHEIDVLKGRNWMECPCCYKNQHSCHVDGNAKLYRYSCVPRGERKCYYGNVFVEEYDAVEAHLDIVYASASSKKNTSNSYCGTSNWKAARNTANVRSKLDETGLVVAGCRHALAQSALNMYRGELFGYTHYLQINRLVPQGVMFLWQDVVCKYWPWFMSLPKELSPQDTFLMKPALSIMHGKAHIWSCQVTWGGRWQQGSAYTTGEEVEQINSYISRLGSTTKYMNAGGRDETITEHVMHWNKQKVMKLHISLSKRYIEVACQMTIPSCARPIMDNLMRENTN